MVLQIEYSGQQHNACFQVMQLLALVQRRHASVLATQGEFLQEMLPIQIHASSIEELQMLQLQVYKTEPE